MWKAYDEQFRALMAVYPRPWSTIEQGLWSMCVTCPQHPAAPMSVPQPPQNSTQGKKQKGGNNPSHGNRGGHSQQKGGTITWQKGTKDQCAGTTRWMCAGVSIANTHTSVHGAKGPIRVTNAPTSISLPLHPSQNGGQNYNAPIHDNKIGFAPRPPLLKMIMYLPQHLSKSPQLPRQKYGQYARRHNTWWRPPKPAAVHAHHTPATQAVRR